MGMVGLRLTNGVTIEGATEDWVSAILMVLNEEQKGRVFHMVQNKMVAHKVPGHYVLHAEGGNLNLTGGSLGNKGNGG